MKVIKGKFNDISPELLKKIPKLEHGKEVVFQMLNGIKNPDPDPDEQRKRPMLYPKHNIPTRDRIKDIDGDYKDLILCDAWKGDEPLRQTFFMPGKDLGGLFMGKFSLFGGNAKDEELYEYLMLTNSNQDSVLGKERDTSILPIFKCVSAKNDSAQIVGKVAIIKKALDISDKITEEEGRELASSLNWNTYPEWSELHAKIIEFSRVSPDEFLKFYQDPMKAIKSEIKAALDAQIINYDLQSGTVKMGDNTLYVLPKADRNDFLNNFALWFNTAKNAKEIRQSIKSQLADKKELVA